jgi:hypothetical protein
MRNRLRVSAVAAAVAPLAICIFVFAVAGQEQPAAPPKPLPGLLSKGSLHPPLPSDLTRVKFSPNGDYILAQDASNIFVLTRQPLAPQFQIDAPAAGPAQFTPDSSEVVFDTGTLRLSVERWSVADGKRTASHGVVLVGNCVESLLSPDGKSLACFSEHPAATIAHRPVVIEPVFDLDFELIDVMTGDAIATKQPFISGSYDNASFMSDLRRIGRLGAPGMTPAIPAAFSPDARYFAAAFAKQTIAVDLASRAVIPLHGDLEWILGGGFTFVSPERVLAQNQRDPERSEILEFPSGLVTNTMPLATRELEPATRGSYVFLRPIKVAPLGVVDWASRTVVGSLEPTGIDIYDKVAVLQQPNGRLALSDFPDGKVEATLALPIGGLGTLEASAVSPDLRWLALSTRARGAVWDLSTMERRYLLRTFTGAYFDGEALYADFSKLGDTPRSIVRADLSATHVEAAHPIDEASLETKQYGNDLLSRIAPGKPSSGGSIVVADARDGHTLWTREFPKPPPANIEISPDQNRAVFRWSADDKPALEQIKNDKTLKARYDKIADRIGAYLFQALDAASGKILGNVLVETSRPPIEGPATPPTSSASGDWLLVTVDPQQTLLYSISTGDLKASVSGKGVIASPVAGLFVAQPEEAELQLYSLPGAEKRALLAFPSPVSFVRFSGDAKRLFVLTQDQNFYIFDATMLAQPDPAQSPR